MNVAALRTTNAMALAGPAFAGTAVFDRYLVPAAALSALLTTTPVLAGFDNVHRYEDTALQSRPHDNLTIDSAIAERIRALAAYEAGWDGPDSIGPTVETVRQAMAFARNFQTLRPIAQPYISLANDGEINFYWKTPCIVLDLGFTGTGRYSYYGQASDGTEYAEDEAELGQPLPLDLIAALRS